MDEAKLAGYVGAGRTIVDVLTFVIYTLLRGTFVWLGALLIDLPSLGLPAMTWLQAVGLVMAFRALVTQVIGVRQAASVPSPLMDAATMIASLQASMEDAAMKNEAMKNEAMENEAMKNAAEKQFKGN
jgi:hypothetical protein